MKRVFGFILIGLVVAILGRSGECLAGDPTDTLGSLEFDVSMVPADFLVPVERPNGRRDGDPGDGMDGDPGDGFGLSGHSSYLEHKLTTGESIGNYPVSVLFANQVLEALILTTRF